jgi:hypothetical protein
VKPSISLRIWFSVCSRSSAAEASAAAAPHRVDLIDEDDTGRLVLGRLEQVPHPRRTNADEHLDELRAADAVVGHAGLTRHGTRQHGLAGAGRPHQQHALEHGRADPPEAFRVRQMIDDLDQVGLGVGKPCHVVETDLGVLLAEALGLGLGEAEYSLLAARTARQAALHAPAQVQEAAKQEHPGYKGHQEPAPDPAAGGLGCNLDAVALQQRKQLGIRDLRHRRLEAAAGLERD